MSPILALAIVIWVICAAVIVMCIAILVELWRSSRRRKAIYERLRALSVALRQTLPG